MVYKCDGANYNAAVQILNNLDCPSGESNTIHARSHWQKKSQMSDILTTFPSVHHQQFPNLSG